MNRVNFGDGRRWMILGALILVSACSHQPKRVDCDGRLDPINAATPVTAKHLKGEAGEP